MTAQIILCILCTYAMRNKQFDDDGGGGGGVGSGSIDVASLRILLHN